MTRDEFLRCVQEKIGRIDREEATLATAAVFQALRDRITPVGAEQLAAQLPRELKAIWEAGEAGDRRRPGSGARRSPGPVNEALAPFGSTRAG
jgi:uncharacterized protein (DUF2267 family)